MYIHTHTQIHNMKLCIPTQVTKLYGSPTYFPVFRAIRIQLLHKKVENTLILRGIDVIGEFFDVDSTSHLYKFQPNSFPIYD